jgi:predicted nuclease of restriction endonuclease-like RecB superfamily
MLPSNLLAVWKRKGTIQPRFARGSANDLIVAKTLIDAYKLSVGKKKITLKKVGEELEDEGYDFHLVRGLSLLLDRKGAFECASETEPVELRRRLFRETGKTGPAIDAELRKGIVEKVASELEIPTRELEESIYADLESELILQHFHPISPQELLKKYNLGLAQTLLFNATEIKFTVSGNWQNIFFKAKRLGLIYEAYKFKGFWVKIDGPASLFKLTRRYGSAIAKILPAIVVNTKWTVEAKILWKFTNRIYEFKLESGKHKPLFGVQVITEAFDSYVEEDFANRFKALNSKWRLKREPEPVIAGQQVIIPDFSFEREGSKLYMEVVGFWTKEYLLRKIAKLKKTKERILVVVDEDLACERLTKLEKQKSLNIVYYRKKIPLPPILRYLEQIYKETQDRQLKLLKDLRISFTEPVIKFKEFAARTGVSVEAVRVVLSERPPEGYVVLPESLVGKDKLEKIRERLDGQMAKTGKLSLKEAAEIGENEGVDLTSAFESLGYKVVWHGINPEKAEIIKFQTEVAQKTKESSEPEFQ